LRPGLLCTGNVDMPILQVGRETGHGNSIITTLYFCIEDRK
jgi:hypothetical protein